jgi:uncharacterized protein
MRSFEFDPLKSATNKRKHGIDFEQAQGLWDDPKGLVRDARSQDEPRHMLTARLGAVWWAAFFTMRGDTIRIISVRKARREERNAYENSDS